ncbi:hypothetical protein D9Q98_007032 [Chlorella vulgaris]|uniref:Glycosyl transferase family 1 domain-containing protein n=1 Tax=Chlorella vulgaris TaxID=3077 RepID=A0A9D4TJD3_CHLVU|nr:hypothetical protein D9Q98_007032 [Chlorella vulgaris]
MARPVKQGAGRRFLGGLPLLWQWLLVFVLTIVVLRHFRWLQMSASLEEQQLSKEGDFPGQPQKPGASGGGFGSISRGWASLQPREAGSKPARQCPVSVPWDTLPRDPAKTRAAVFTPYNIVFGGGERYLLSVVAVMQSMGYTVDILMFHRNVCQTKEQLLKVANGLRVALDPELLELHFVTAKGIWLQVPREDPGYSLFLSLGNDKLPTFAGLGHVNFYMCQFPFDLERPPRPGTTKAFSTYDYVLLNSEYTDRWYNFFSGPHIANSLRVWNAAPSVVVLYPPVEPFPAMSQVKKPGDPQGLDTEAHQPQRLHIVLLGRFFKGRQSKGHAGAIDIFRRLQPRLPPTTQLHLIGNLMPGHKAYLNDLKQRAQNLPVHFHVGVPAHVIEEVLHSSLVQWHLTGVELEPGAEDPASEEHFGISIAEGMSAGVIPVVLNRGGVTDIVKHKHTGFLAADSEAVAELTAQVFGLEEEALGGLRRAATSWVERFSQKAFAKNFRILANRGVLTKPFRFLQQQTQDVVLSRSFILPKRSTKAALIIEPRQHWALEHVVKNTMHHLGPDWALHVYHGTANDQFVHEALQSLENVNFRLLDTVSVPIPMLNQLLKATEFWGELAAVGVEHVLFFQTDSLLVHGNVEPFLQYDYVGAPWHLKNERWGPAQAAMPQGVGNGGLSLRGVAAMAGLSAAHGGNASTAAQQEDFFYSALMERPGSQFQLAPRQLAYSFCVEVPCEDLEGSLGEPDAQPETGALLQTLLQPPMALHASWYYFWGSSRRFSDLLALLEMSVCGPEGYRELRAAGGGFSPKPELLWQDSRRALAALARKRARLAKHKQAGAKQIPP